jgi:hypothetical protein
MIPVVLLAGGLSTTLVAAPRFFTTDFKHHLTPHLQDLDEAFVVGDGFAHLRGGEPNVRHYITTARSDYLSSDWTYEITVQTPPNAPPDLLFIGFGEGVPDDRFVTEPRNSVTFRIAQGATDTSGGNVDVAAHDVGFFSFTYFESIGHLKTQAGATWIARIRKIGPSVTLEILGTSIAVTIDDIYATAPFLKDVPTRMFFGNALGAYSFTDMRVLPERPHGHGKMK